MVLTITAPLWSDISDRSARQLGLAYMQMYDYGSPEPLHMAGNDGLIVSPKPWWAHHGYGEVHTQDDFEGTLKWRNLGGTISKASDPTFVHDGTSSMKMVTGAIANNIASAGIELVPPTSGTHYIKMELWWCLNAAAATTPQSFMVQWEIQDRTFNLQYAFGFRYLNYLATVYQAKRQYWNSAGAWADIPAPGARPIRTTTPMFNYLLFILKRTTGGAITYDSIAHNNALQFLTGVGGQTSAFSVDMQAVSVTCVTDAAAATTAYVDSFIVEERARGPT